MSPVRLKISIGLRVLLALFLLCLWSVCQWSSNFLALDYRDQPWEEWMDTKLAHPHKTNVTYPTKLDDDGSLSFTPGRLEELLEEPRATCRRLTSIGGEYVWKKNCQHYNRDGNKYVCFDSDVRPVPGDCLIYSVGVGHEVTWDRKMTHLGCRVFAFDMTMDNWTKPFLFSDNLHFLPIGMAGANVDASINLGDNFEEKAKWVYAPFRTLDSIREILGHTDRTIDILKMDIEYEEWSVFKSIFNSSKSTEALKSVKQIALEIHLDGFKNESAIARVENGLKYQDILENLDNHGFKMVHTELNTAFQVYADVRGSALPLFRESLFINRP